MAGYPPPPGGPPVVVMAGVPGQLTMGGGAPGERTVASQEGGTQLLDAHNIQILYNAEIRGRFDCFAICEAAARILSATHRCIQGPSVPFTWPVLAA